jgi:hypothetical protein
MVELLKKRKIKQLAREAAARTLNGNGSSPNLPPLPNVNDERGLGTLFSHPYGALPYGNIFLSDSDNVRENGLGRFRRLNDEQVLSVLQYLDAKSLSNVLKTSRFMYVAGHHEELWRDLMLRRSGSSGFEFCSSWKDTFIRAEFESKGKLHLFYRHQPIRMKGIYSDTLFRSWLCRSFELQDSWLAVNNVCIEDSDTLTVDRFLSEYEETNTPVIVRGATSSWPALKKWNEDYLAKETAGMTFRATSGVAPLPAQFTMDSYAKYCNAATEEAPLYLFDRTFAHKCPQLLKDFEDPLKKSCPFFDNVFHCLEFAVAVLLNNKRLAELRKLKRF